MARGTPAYFEGTILSSSGNVAEQFFLAVEGHITSYQSGGSDAWELFDEITVGPTSRDVVYRSQGDRSLVGGAGDARLFVRMDNAANRFRVRTYQDWSSGSSTGTRASSIRQTNVLNTTDTLKYYGVVNEYEVAIVWIQSGVWYHAWWGSPRRTHVPDTANGIAFQTANYGAPETGTVDSITNSSGTATLVADGTPFSASGGEVGRYIRVGSATNSSNNGDFLILTNPDNQRVTYATTAPDIDSEGPGSPATWELSMVRSIDRDLTAGPTLGLLAVGQRVSIYNISDTASLKAHHSRTLWIKAVSTTTITTLGGVESQDSGAIIGQDPSPCGCLAGQSSWSSTVNFCNANGPWENNQQTFTTSIYLESVSEPIVDPGPEGLYYGSSAVMTHSFWGSRGTQELVSFWAHGTQVNKDRMQVNYLTTDAASWKIFPALKKGNYAVALGPGAPAS